MKDSLLERVPALNKSCSFFKRMSTGRFGLLKIPKSKQHRSYRAYGMQQLTADQHIGRKMSEPLSLTYNHVYSPAVPIIEWGFAFRLQLQGSAPSFVHNCLTKPMNLFREMPHPRADTLYPQGALANFKQLCVSYFF